ncbi:MAG: UvrD-helicase domain-containing protein [Planctomycetales bacterium]|nr:UvrD-helicase domain-containing protein [Planctomycetales bacterium]
MKTDSLLHQLNASQRQAVVVDSGPLLVLAGAGTGKTRVVTYRIARLIDLGIRPERILAVTFTNKAANEMKERIKALLSSKSKETPEISTFHSLCVRVLRRHITQLGYPQRFTIYDRSDQESVAAQVLREISVATATLRPADLLAMIGTWKTQAIRAEQALNVASTDKEHLAAIAYRRYQKALRASGGVDFDDLLLCTEQLLEEFPDIRRQEAERFDHILVDEYQDTNTSQYRIIKQLALRHRNLCVVGDDDQSIYAWRGAEVRHILNFDKDWPRAKVVRLEENYRCTEQILKLANRLIKYNKERHDKTLNAARPGGEKPRILQLPDETQEAEQIVGDIQRQLAKGDLEPNDFAILFRTNEQPRAFETELRRRNLPYTLIGGMSFYDRREVKDLLSYLRLLVQPHDEPALLRIINTPPRGISRQAVTAMIDAAVKEGCPVWKIMSRVADLPDFSRQSIEGARQMMTLVDEYQQKLRKQGLSATVRELVAKIDYRSEIGRRYKEDADAQEARWRAVEEVVNSVAEYEERAKKPSLEGFLDEIMLSGREQDSDKEKKLQRNSIILMTLHSAKGLEFPHVYMVGMEEGLLPHKRSVDDDGDSIAEERRLCYVGITRAQERLTLSFALTRRKWGKPRPTHPSRFLFEITGKADR